MMKPSSLIYLRTLYKVDDPLFSPLKNFFLKIPENMLKFGKFQKSRFFGGPEEGFWFWTLQNDFIYDYLLLLEGWRPKNPIFQKILHLENVVFKLFGGPGESPSENFLPIMVSKGQSHLKLKIHCLLNPKNSFWNDLLMFFLRGCVEHPPPISNRVKILTLFFQLQCWDSYFGGYIEPFQNISPPHTRG